MATRDPKQFRFGSVTGIRSGADTGSALPAVSSWLSIVTIALFFGIGGWQRRWISDDGLIVLRTVRNLLADNGPVFNAGERVEVNTSVLWQYIIYGIASLSSARLESIAIYTGLVMSVLAAMIAALGSVALHRARRTIIVPCGLLLYICLPPARDFTTSGLEWGLSLLWIALLWTLLVFWHMTHNNPQRQDSLPLPHRNVPRSGYALAIWAGLSWLVRPELALYGAATLLILLIVHRRWTLLACALPLPMIYEVFRAGYYGLLVPNTAVAKSASDSNWDQGWHYVLDFTSPYWLWLILPVAIIIAIAVFHVERRGLPLPATVMMICAIVHTLYVVKIGGDFMHGRMWLLPLFAFLMPIGVVPIHYTAFSPTRRRTHTSTTRPSDWGTPRQYLDDADHSSLVPTLITVAGCAGILTWGIIRLGTGHPYTPPTTLADVKGLSIVDEREFWTGVTGHSSHNPLTKAEDFLAAPSMINYIPSLKGLTPKIDNHTRHTPSTPTQVHPFASIMTTPYKDIRGVWTPLPLAATPDEKNTLARLGTPSSRADTTTHHADNTLRTASGLNNSPMTVSFLNLGMTSMNAALDVRIVDPVGLANPLAARQHRIPNGRIGHDKSLPSYWQLADTAMPLTDSPFWENEKHIHSARTALQNPDFVSLFETYRSPMSFSRFLRNITFAVTKGTSLTFSSKPGSYTPTIKNSPPRTIQWEHTTKLDSDTHLPRSLRPGYTIPRTHHL